MYGATFIKVELSKTDKAFRFNGVTFAKRQLAKLFPRESEINEQVFCRFLVLMPFLAITKKAKDAPTEAGKYAVKKCERMFAALGLPDEDRAVAAFMMAVGQMGEVEPQNFGDIMDQVHDHVCNCGKKGAEPAIRLATRDGQTVH